MRASGKHVDRYYDAFPPQSRSVTSQKLDGDMPAGSKSPQDTPSVRSWGYARRVKTWIAEPPVLPAGPVWCHDSGTGEGVGRAGATAGTRLSLSGRDDGQGPLVSDGQPDCGDKRGGCAVSVGAVARAFEPGLVHAFLGRLFLHCSLVPRQAHRHRVKNCRPRFQRCS